LTFNFTYVNLLKVKWPLCPCRFHSRRIGTFRDLHFRDSGFRSSRPGAGFPLAFTPKSACPGP
jgi:hypothetical protein